MAVGNEQRIVTETTPPARTKRDAPLAHAGGQRGALLQNIAEEGGGTAQVVIHLDRGGGDHATKAGGALGLGYTLERGQQFLIVRGVGRVAGDVRADVGEARGIDARRTTQGVHFQATVIRQHEHRPALLGIFNQQGRLKARVLEQPAREFHRLFLGILIKRAAVLAHDRSGHKMIQCEVAAIAAEYGLNLLHFVGVPRGDDERDHAVGKLPSCPSGGKPKFARCGAR